MNISLEGLDKIEARIDGLSKIDFTDALWKAAFTVERDAKQNCPVDTGQLRASIYSRVKGNEASVGTNVEYAPWTHMRSLNRANSVKAKIKLIMPIPK